MFDMYTYPTVQLLYLLNTFYDDVYICKPYTSRVANSEKYIVCQGFKRELKEDIFMRFKNILGIIEKNEQTTNNKLVFYLNTSIKLSFKTQITLINSIFGQRQLENIHKTISLIHNKNARDKTQGEKMKNVEKCIKWCKTHDIPYNEIVRKNIFSFSE